MGSIGDLVSRESSCSSAWDLNVRSCRRAGVTFSVGSAAAYLTVVLLSCGRLGAGDMRVAVLVGGVLGWLSRTVHEFINISVLVVISIGHRGCRR